MLFYSSIVIVTSIIAKQYNKHGKKRKIWFWITIIILSVISGIRYGIGLDYIGYVRLFNKAIQGLTPTEIGFTYINRWIYSLGGDVQWVIAIFGFCTVYLFLKAYDQQSTNFAISVYFYLVLGYYFYSFNSVRYYFTVALSVYAYPLIKKKKLVPYCALIAIGFTIHKSIIISVLIHLLSTIRINNRHQGIMYFIFSNIGGIGAYSLRTQIRSIMFHFYPSYEGSGFDDSHISVLNILVCGMLIGGLLLWYDYLAKNIHNYGNMLAMICIAFAIYTYCYWIPEVSRVGYYAMGFSPIVFSNILSSISDSKDRFLVKFILICLFFIMFLYVMYSSYLLPSPGLLPYKSIFSK